LIKTLQEKVDHLTKQANYAAGSYRIIEKLEREIEDLKKKEEKVQTSEGADIYEVLEKDMAKGIEMVVERTLKKEREKVKQEEQISQIERERNEQMKLLEENQQKVLQKHPELSDITSEKTKAWFEVLKEHPEYKTNYLGPILAMRDMEDKLKEHTGESETNTKDEIDKEVNRRLRAQASSIPKGKSHLLENEIVLTKEQKELCDRNNWDYKVYAKTLKRLLGEKQVEVTE
jgi:hypothetical protein